MTRRKSSPASPVSRRIPSYRLHKPTGRAVVTLCGTDFYLGRWNSPESHQEYSRLIAEWVSNNYTLRRPQSNITVAEVAAAFLDHATTYYVKNGEPTGWQAHIKLVLKRLRTLYGMEQAADFGPLAFKAIRQTFIEEGKSRNYINKLMRIILRVFRWATSEELIPASVHQQLATVDGLRKGRTIAPDHPPVMPVSDEVVEETLKYLGPIVADMVRLQRLTGARPNEICIIRPIDVNRDGDVWTYHPMTHKTEHHDRARVIMLGPKAQAILCRYLLRAETEFCFSPIEAEQNRRQAAHAARKTPLNEGNRPGTNRKSKPERKPADHYTVDSYRRAIHRAVSAANKARERAASEIGDRVKLLPQWNPNQLRHSVGTQVRAEFGLEASQVVLGHSQAKVTEIYAERDMRLAADVARRLG